MAVFAVLAITVLVKIGPGHYTTAVRSPASSPNQRLSDITDAMIYGSRRSPARGGCRARRGGQEHAPLGPGQHRRHRHRHRPFYLLVIGAEAFAAGRHGIAGFVGRASPLGYLTSRYWSRSP